MQVDNQRHLFSPSPFTDDLSHFFHTELFSAPSSSRASSPQSPFLSALLTPPQSAPPSSFPDPSTILNPSIFNYLDDESHSISKPFVDPMSAAPFDFLASSFASPTDLITMGIDMHSGIGMDFGIDMMDTAAAGNGGLNFGGHTIGIDPQLVGTPSTSQAMSDFDEDEQLEEGDGAYDDHDADADVSASASPGSSSAASPPVIKSKSRSSKKVTEKDKDKDKEPEREKLTLTIAPVKVGGHGKARKGTVQTGGIVKKAAPTQTLLAVAAKDKENARLSSMPPPALPPPSNPALTSYMPTNVYTQTPTGFVSAGGKPRPDKANAEDDEDELPHDWRPSPEVFSKMTSKEKRQLRNKISARNFRVRRKGDLFFFFFRLLERIYLFIFDVEYISTLEGDIAERDRLLDAIRSELGSTQSENLALRQEIATLKRTLLEGRGIISTSLTPSSSDATSDAPILNLPPPAPLPAQSAVALLAQQQATSTSTASTPPPTQSTPNLLTPNTQKDVSSTSTNRFWGGVSGLGGMGMGMGGITPVHRVVLPEVSVMGMGLFGSSSMFNRGEKSTNAEGERGEGEKLQENVNPMLNRVGTMGASPNNAATAPGMGAFDGFADVNPFTMKTLDAYRMHLWGKMAAQHHAYQYQQQQQQHQQQHQQQPQAHSLTGLASSMRPSYFSSPTLPPYSSSSTSLSALLSGKHTSSYAHSVPPNSPPPPYSSPKLGEKEKSGLLEKLERERETERVRERETAMYAALASQTLLRRLGSTFWDAFSGGSGSGSALGSASGSGGRALDEDKVRRVLEGKAVVRVVDVDEPVRSAVALPQMQAQRMLERERENKRREMREMKASCKCQTAVTDILEESMRSLSLGKKV